jgi:malonyl-CoA O-methyltransferase
MHRCLNDQGRLLLSTFGPGTLWELRDSWASVSSATHVNEFDSLEQVGDSLHAAGFRDVVVESEVIQLLYPDAKALMRELKAIGAHNTNHGRPSGLTGRKRMQGMLEHYRQYRNKEGLWPASYEVVYATAGR